jgi:type IV pilus assembly protein PilW
MHKNKGFTLPELMIAMAVGSIIMAVIYSTYQAQQKSYTTQHLGVEMQQNIRAAMSLMKREIRMAGYDPEETSGADILSAAGS